MQNNCEPPIIWGTSDQLFFFSSFSATLSHLPIGGPVCGQTMFILRCSVDWSSTVVGWDALEMAGMCGGGCGVVFEEKREIKNGFKAEPQPLMKLKTFGVVVDFTLTKNACKRHLWWGTVAALASKKNPLIFGFRKTRHKCRMKPSKTKSHMEFFIFKLKQNRSVGDCKIANQHSRRTNDTSIN